MYVSALTAEGEIAADQVADGVSKSGRVLRSSYWVCFWCLCQSGHLVLFLSAKRLKSPQMMLLLAAVSRSFQESWQSKLVSRE